MAGAMLWIGQILTMGEFVWKKKNLILAKDAAMFLTPCYDGVFLEQHTRHETVTPTFVNNNDEADRGPSSSARLCTWRTARR